MSIDIIVNSASLADVLNEMREWLDANRLTLSLFRYKKHGTGRMMIQVQCADHDREQAELFRARFQNPV